MTIQNNLEEVRANIEKYAAKFGHRPEEVCLIGVTKTFEEDKIRQAIDSGLEDVGENRVQEILRKRPFFEGARVHMIGQLQRNKVKKLTEGIDLIQSVDRLSLLDEMEKVGEKEGALFSVLIQLNLAREAQKGGCPPEDLPLLLDHIEELQWVKCRGLMMVAPNQEAEAVRPYFRQMRKMFDNYSNIGYNNSQMRYLSMGMSHDYTVALEEGANMIRIGRAIFGDRDYSK